eukprot:TRINITY_DN13282_c0_g1_i1.p1 TRINITY_DN13282_c0_g1~~TRINITY_DN13282_c0_g1_i1.p1  ORF type:complete len:414 (-),score=108.73 TRINITY_DN13282_c0_g1_i1:38-1279(-)
MQSFTPVGEGDGGQEGMEKKDIKEEIEERRKKAKPLWKRLLKKKTLLRVFLTFVMALYGRSRSIVPVLSLFATVLAFSLPYCVSTLVQAILLSACMVLEPVSGGSVEDSKDHSIAHEDRDGNEERLSPPLPSMRDSVDETGLWVSILSSWRRLVQSHNTLHQRLVVLVPVTYGAVSIILLLFTDVPIWFVQASQSIAIAVVLCRCALRLQDMHQVNRLLEASTPLAQHTVRHTKFSFNRELVSPFLTYRVDNLRVVSARMDNLRLQAPYGPILILSGEGGLHASVDIRYQLGSSETQKLTAHGIFGGLRGRTVGRWIKGSDTIASKTVDMSIREGSVDLEAENSGHGIIANLLSSFFREEIRKYVEKTMKKKGIRFLEKVLPRSIDIKIFRIVTLALLGIALSRIIWTVFPFR